MSSVLEILKEVMTLTATTGELKEQVDKVSGRLDSLPQSAEVEGVTELKEELTKFKALLLSDPDKALALPLVKKDIEGIQGEIDALRRQIELVASYSKWAIGAMITLGLGAIGLAVSALLK